MEWPAGPIILDGHQIRPGRDRGRLASDHPHRQQAYYQDMNGLLMPAVGVGRSHRAASVSEPRPAQIVINNEQYERHSPQPSPNRHRRHSHGHDYHYDDYSDDSWDERAHSPRRHRRHSRHRREPSRSPSPSPMYDLEYERKMKKLAELEKREEEEEARERFEQERILEDAKKAKRKKEEDELKKKAIEEYHKKQLEEKAKKEEEKKKADEEFKNRLKETFGKAGYDDESIEKLLKKGPKEKDHGHGHGKQKQIMDLSRPTYIKVHRKHLSPETLDHYVLPWEWDEVNAPSKQTKEKKLTLRP